MNRIVSLFGAFTVLVCPASGLSAQQPMQVSGVFQITWVDTFRPDEPHTALPTLVGDDGRVYLLDVPAPVLEARGGMFTLAGRRVTVRTEPVAASIVGDRAAAPRLRVRSIEGVEGTPLLENRTLPARSAAVAPVQRLPYVTLLCRYADLPGETQPRGHYEQMMSGSFPNVGHYWNHVSGGRLSLEGSRTYGWYTLPHPTTYYEPRGGARYIDYPRLLEDCMAAADADVFFPAFEGIILQVDGGIGNAAGFATYGHSTRDGVSRAYRLVVAGGGADAGLYMHEIGHTLGLPHSGGQYGKEYDSRWDLMSGGARASLPDGAEVRANTIAAYHDWLGWFPEHQRFVAPVGTSTVTLDALRGENSDGNVQIAVIPLPQGHAYTLEVRRRQGYDAGVPADAVVVHHVRSGNPRAYVVDVDGNANPNDEGAIWRVGETFRDRVLGVEVSIDREAGSGFQVTIRAPAVDSISVVEAPHRRAVPFGGTAALRDSAFVRVAGPNAGSIHWTATSGSNVELESTSGTGTGWVRWSRRTAGMPAGESIEVISISSASVVSTSMRLADTLVVAPPAGVAAGFARLPGTDTLLVGQSRSDDWLTGPSIDLRIGGPGAQDAAWSVAKRPPWLEVEPTSGRGDALLLSARSAVGLLPGVYTDTLRIEVEGAERPALLVLRLVVLPPLEIVPRQTSVSVRAPQGTFTEVDSVYVELRGDWAGTARLHAVGSGPTMAVDHARTGSGWMRFRRTTAGRAPGPHAGGLRLFLAHDEEAAFSVTIADTVHVEAAPPRLALIRSGGVDTVRAGEWSESAVLVQPRGDGSTTNTWRAIWNPARTTVLNWYGSEVDADRQPQVGPMTLRWTRNGGDRQPGLNVDTLLFAFTSGPPGVFSLLDSIWVEETLQSPVTITSATARPGARVGATYADTLRATGGSGSYRWSIVSGALPGGLALDSVTGIVSGTAMRAGSYGFGAGVRSGEQSASIAFTLNVASGPLAITTDSVRPTGLMGAPYSDSLQVSETGTGVRWRLLDGAFPPGVSLDSTTGRMNGVAEGAGSYRFVLEARAGDRTAEGPFRVSIGKPVLQSAAVLDHLLGGAGLTADQVRFLDLLGNRNTRLDVGDVRAWLLDSTHLDSQETARLRSIVGAPDLVGGERGDGLDGPPRS